MMRDRSGSLRPNPQSVLRWVVQAVGFSCVVAGTILSFPAAFVPAAPAPLPRRPPHDFRPFQGRWKVVGALRGHEFDVRGMASVIHFEFEIRDRTFTAYVGKESSPPERLFLKGTGTQCEFECHDLTTGDVKRRGIYAVDGTTLRLAWTVEDWLLRAGGDVLPLEFECPPPAQRTLILSRVQP